MVLDINLIRNNVEVVRKSQNERLKGSELLDKVIQIDNEWRKERYNTDNLNRLKNLCSKTISKKMKNKHIDGDDCSDNMLHLKEEELMSLSVSRLKLWSKDLDQMIIKSLEVVKALESERDSLLNEIGNILHPTVIIHDDEDYNGVIRMHGDTTNKKLLSHIDLVEMVGGVDFKKGAQNCGSRCYYLDDPLASLECALITFGRLFMRKKHYKLVSPPCFMNKDAMQQVAQLAQFDSELYKVECKRSEDPTVDEGVEVKYLIATSEQPLVARFRDTWIPKTDLPIRLLGVSECFRQEVGSHGRDTRGIFRVHQFKKVEQFCVTSPHDGESERMFAEMVGNSEAFYQQLGIPYRVVSIVSGALNNAAAIKYDLEGWFPGSGAFRELVSVSNCTDYQARSVLARYGETKAMNEDVEFVHMLNGTLCATTRVMCAIMENYQTEEGIVVPQALRPFMPDDLQDIIPFVKSHSKK